MWYIRGTAIYEVYTINGLRFVAQPIYRIAIVQVCTIP